MATSGDRWEKKIRNEDLRNFIASEQADPVSVLIEVEAPDSVLELTHPPSGRGMNFRVQSVQHIAEPRDNGQRAIEQLRTLLETLHLPYHFLQGARAFVASPTPQQLRCITASPFVRSVIPNHRQKLGMPRSHQT
ncbi:MULTISPECIES: hypothetical protein [unclassified Leptolyngbya]|uniref:hypothetical protein n=1 Tax=unclassified Leptolyngbya TaxID=2650499 RepID=UPI001685F23B|nr:MULTISPECIES: hypothetical protein [unclassified Leptolyngbya]MBD1911639.1 hypothetical protein [Leptolyngbya sp. FACHB-8]MBD2157837.1 hypothetical protein [Leptolyngbya sp. FACHB-16]